MQDSSIDFRLLECLHALVAECHVTRAAERLGMAQPRLSSALGRLRRITGDPLLVRTARGMVPTQMARDLAASSGRFLRDWSSLVGQSTTFEPAEAETIFRIHAIDAVSAYLLPPALKAIELAAPGVSISVGMPSVLNLRDALENGEIDVAIGQIEELPQELFVSQLSSFPWCAVVRRGHPRIGDCMDFEAYAAERHVMLTFGRHQEPLLTERFVNTVFEEQHLRRRVGLFTPSVLAVPSIVSETDLVGLVPERLARQSAAYLPIVALPAPVELPRQHLTMIWHARTRNDPSHRWFRAKLRAAARNQAALHG